MDPVANQPTTNSESTFASPTIELLAPSGLGYGAGTVSYGGMSDFIEDGRMKAAIKQSTLITTISASVADRPDVDGCSEASHFESGTVDPALYPRVPGGGAVVAFGAMIGSGKAQDTDPTALYELVATRLKTLEIPYGIHVGTRLRPEDSGCVVIDKTPEILANIMTFQQQILGTLSALHMNMGSVDEVYSAYMNYTEKHLTKPGFSGLSAVEALARSGAIVQQHQGSHDEQFVVLNNVAHSTVDHHYLATVEGGPISTFGVDLWRMRALSDALFPTDPISAHKAYLSTLIYTFGVLATLTKGDQPIFSVS